MRPILLAACALGACSIQPADQNAADQAAPTENVVAETVSGPPPVKPAAPGTPGGLDNDMTPISEAPFTEESAQGAANVVQTYYALIGEKKYAAAWALWENAGKASGMSARAFAESFDKYSQYNAQIGAPGAIDAGAGQRYVSVPVQVYGRLKADNRPFNLRGSVTLHRTVADGASAEQRAWRIRATDIKPRPGEAAPDANPPGSVDNRSTARYKCVDGSRMNAAFDPDNNKVTITRAGKTLVLKQERVASGIRYASGGTSFAGKGQAMTLTLPGMPPLPCAPLRR